MQSVRNGSNQIFDYPDRTLHYQHLDWGRLVSPLFLSLLWMCIMLGEALRLIRIFHDCKTGELANGLGVSPSYISEIESGKKTPSLETLKKYADYFDTTVSAIMFFAENVENEKKGSPKTRIRKNLIKFLQIIENVTKI